MSKGNLLHWNRRSSGWVSVEERLPERLEFVFVYCQPLTELTNEYSMAMDFHDGKEWAMTFPDRLDPRWSWTHWLPIPAPPEDEAGQ